MRAGVKTAVVLIGGLLTGLVSAQLAIPYSGQTLAGSGPNWYSFQSDDTPQPYQRAHYLLAGRLPPPRSLLFEVEAMRDSSGVTLDGDCTYNFPLPPQRRRWWRLFADTNAAAIKPNAAASSHSILTGPDGRVSIAISPVPQPGNWINPETSGGFRLVYAMALEGPDAIGTPSLPLVKRGECL